jgi:hypothetical protein
VSFADQDGGCRLAWPKDRSRFLSVLKAFRVFALTDKTTRPSVVD